MNVIKIKGSPTLQQNLEMIKKRYEIIRCLEPLLYKKIINRGPYSQRLNP